MNLEKKLAISYYKTIAIINEPHNVYLVQHQESNKIFIKKILDVYNLSVYEQLYNNHITGTPEIIELYEENNQLTVIEEYISGTSLLEKIQKCTLTQNDITCYMLDLCDTLIKLHNLNPAVIHRDIKPSNVIITNYNRAILLDFNAAKYYSSNSNEDTILLGTQGYAAPEQYGFGSSSPQTDIYSLGVLLKEMLLSIPNAANQLNSIANKCTQLNPKERFKNVKDLRSAVLPFIDQSTKPINDYSSSDFENKSTSRFLPPGYRSKTPWKMLLSSCIYLVLIWFISGYKNVRGISALTILEQIFLVLIAFAIIFGCFNYMDIQRFMPLCKSKYKWLHYIGIILLDISLVFILLLILAIIEIALFP